MLYPLSYGAPARSQYMSRATISHPFVATPARHERQLAEGRLAGETRPTRAARKAHFPPRATATPPAPAGLAAPHRPAREGSARARDAGRPASACA